LHHIPVQHIIDQLEYSPIKRRLEAGVFSWEWANQDDDEDDSSLTEQHEHMQVDCDDSKSEELTAIPSKKQQSKKPGSAARVRNGGYVLQSAFPSVHC
jgi:hypothetical protein